MSPKNALEIIKQRISQNSRLISHNSMKTPKNEFSKMVIDNME